MVYQSSEQKAIENHSTGIMLMVVGGIGFIADLFVLTLNPLNMPMFNRYLSCGVMGALFVLFFVMGILSVKTYRIFSAKAKEENNMLAEVRKWCESNLTKEIIDEATRDSFDDEQGFIAEEEESKYFKRCEYIKERISNQYVNIDNELLDSFVDDYYTGIYGD